MPSAAKLGDISFFESPPPREPLEEEEFERPAWVGPPTNVLGAAVPLRLLLARTVDVAVAVVDATAYPNGFEFRLALPSRRPSVDDFEEPFDLHPLMWRHRMRGRDAVELPPELFRFGIEFANGSKAATVGGHPFERGPDDEPEGPVLIEHGGGGGGGDWDQTYWVWPLPRRVRSRSCASGPPRTSRSRARRSTPA